MDASGSVPSTGVLRRRARWCAIGFSALAVVWSPVANLLLGDQAYTLRNALATVLLLALARASGLRAAELGLARAGLRRGLVVGSVAIVVIATVVVVGVQLQDRIGLVAGLLADQRAVMGRSELWTAVLLRIPVGTAAFEEVLFRGILLAAWCRVLAERQAVLVGAALFGWWHVAPTVVTLLENGIAPTSTLGLTAVVGAVVVTALAAVGFVWLRRVGGDHLVAPWLAHWAINAFGLLAANVPG